MSHTNKFFMLTLDLMVIKDASTHFWKHVNPQVERTLGYSVEELTSQSSMNFIHPEDRAETEQRAESVPSTGAIQNFENRYLTKDGRVVWLCWTAVFEPAENLIYAVAKDVTKSKEQEEQIAQQKLDIAIASRLNSLGRFAAGIAHEVNNPLTIVYGQTCNLRKLIGKKEIDQQEIVKITEQIENMTARIIRIVNGLRAFTRGDSDGARETVCIKTILDDTLAFCRGNFRDQRITLLVDDVPEDIMIQAHPVQISQVLLNLLNNAYDAVLDSTEKWIRVAFQATKAHVEFRVIDSGPGIAQKKELNFLKRFYHEAGWQRHGP